MTFHENKLLLKDFILRSYHFQHRKPLRLSVFLFYLNVKLKRERFIHLTPGIQ